MPIAELTGDTGFWFNGLISWYFFQLFFTGANIYIGIETPYELQLYAEKQEVAKKIDASADYLSAAFWSYIKDYDLYNYSFPQ